MSSVSHSQQNIIESIIIHWLLLLISKLFFSIFLLWIFELTRTVILCIVSVSRSNAACATKFLLRSIMKLTGASSLSSIFPYALQQGSTFRFHDLQKVWKAFSLEWINFVLVWAKMEFQLISRYSARDLKIFRSWKLFFFVKNFWHHNITPKNALTNT